MAAAVVKHLTITANDMAPCSGGSYSIFMVGMVVLVWE